ncbi:hypothetical protein RIR_jg18322.t1 [Rhizophagus irregularis DAOM 181602=DAOM 197198]|nr:hypothetical protein RIR_jg18322.t1 [Rhizophagus irregularis DAOM 181602=DAOM 197198]
MCFSERIFRRFTLILTISAIIMPFYGQYYGLSRLMSNYNSCITAFYFDFLMGIFNYGDGLISNGQL